ncbi:MAG: right-handed parallel beta-helix repeat-containing protein [Acidobacteriota bacterium]|nr:right-handed parallel beta-helix repeat-containing protein [Acidobacteriota bacterium]
MFRLFAAVVLAACIAPVTFAATHYVAPGQNIQSVLDSSGAYDTVILQSGDHYISQTLRLPARTTLKGGGPNRNSVSLIAMSSLVGPVIKAVNDSTGSDRSHKILDMQIISNGTAQSSTEATGIMLWNVQYSEVNNVVIRNTWRMSISMQNSYHIYVFNSEFRDMGFGPTALGSFWINNCDRVWIGDNVIYGMNNGTKGDGGIDCYGSTMVKIYRNDLYDTGESSIYAANAGCPGIEVWGNYITGSNEWGIDLVNSPGAFVSSNEIRNSFHGAIVLWDSPNAEVTYNVMFNNNTGGHVSCNGLNRRGNTSGLTFTNNSGNGTLLCNR